MRYAIVSDIHANLDALEAVLEDAGDVPLLCLGDTVGYGAQPNECVELIRNRALHTVLGNHDLACGDGSGIEYMNADAAKSAFWTHRRLSDANIDFLLALPYTVKTPTFALVHSSPNHPENFTYLDDLYEAEEAFAVGDDLVTFIGHSHLPGIFMLKPDDHIQHIPIAGYRVLHASSLIEQGARLIINVGSTGQPRDNDFRPSYVLYDDVERTISWRRVEYDVAGAQAKIRATTLPKRCADRLESGH
jgi:diadenosine tetraphosphatase ApaH/serine/threonine PP2A family protein phosphatase